MKKLAKIPAILLNKEESIALRLKNEYYAALIPRDLVVGSGLNAVYFDFIVS